MQERIMCHNMLMLAITCCLRQKDSLKKCTVGICNYVDDASSIG